MDLPVERTTLTLVAAAALVLAAGFWRPDSAVTGVPPEQFWNEKLLWGPEYDVVLAGDSRTFQGLSPARMARTLRGRRIVNFGFATVSLSGYYLDAAAARLDPASGCRALVLGVTPHSLTRNAARDNELVSRWGQVRPWHPGILVRKWDSEFLSLSRQERGSAWLQARFGRLHHFFRPFKLRDIQNHLEGQGFGYFQHFHPDGWVASRQVPENHEVMQDWGRKIFLGNPVAPEVLAGLTRSVRELTGQGVRVYAFHFPVPEETDRIELGLSGFDAREVASRLEAAGGVWLELNRHGFASHDGSHLRDDAAERLSDAVARAMLERE